MGKNSPSSKIRRDEWNALSFETEEVAVEKRKALAKLLKSKSLKELKVPYCRFILIPLLLNMQCALILFTPILPGWEGKPAWRTGLASHPPAYVSKCYNKCEIKEQTAVVEIFLKGKIAAAASSSSLWSKEWWKEELPACLARKTVFRRRRTAEESPSAGAAKM